MAPLIMRSSLGSSHRLVQRGVPRPAGTVAAPLCPRRRGLTFIRAAAVEDSVEEPAPAAADAPTLAPAAETAGPAAPEAAPAAAQATSARRGSAGTLKVTNTIDTTAAARYLSSTLVEQPSSTSIRVSAITAQACLNALKILARASEMLQEQDSSSCLTFQPQRRLVQADNEGAKAGVAAVDFYVTRSPAAAFSEDPDTPRLTVHPMRVRSDTEASRVTAHALYGANNHEGRGWGRSVAMFMVSGGLLAPRARLLLDGLTKARNELRSGETDLTFTVSKSMYEVKQDPEAAEQQQQQQLQDGQAAAAGGAEEEGEEVAQRDETSAAASSSASSSSDQSGSNTLGDSNQPRMRPAYLVKAFTCKPRPSAAPRSSSSSSSRGGSSRKAAAAGAGPRPGYVEVPAEEWAQLKEQLEVVPHLTEQLQIMTRQHEQLLSLLAAQGGQAEEQQ